MGQCPPLAKCSHSWDKRAKIHCDSRINTSKPPQCQILVKGYCILPPIYTNASLAFILHGNKNTLGAEINPEATLLKSSKLEVTRQKWVVLKSVI